MCLSKSEGNGFFFLPEMRESRDPQNGCQIGQVSLYMYTFCKIPSILVMIETIRCSFQQLQQTPKVKAKGTLKCTPIVITQHPQIMFCIKSIIMYKFTLSFSFGLSTLFRIKSLNMGYVCHVDPSIWVCFFTIEVPQNGSVSETLTHASKHRVFKSTPRDLEFQLYIQIS